MQRNAAVPPPDTAARVQELDEKLREATADAARWRSEVINQRGELVTARASAQKANAAAADERETSQARGEALDSIFNTVSWKATRPLRFVRRLLKRSTERRPGQVAHVVAPTAMSASSINDALVRRFCDRVCVVTAILDTGEEAQNRSLGEAVLAFERAVDHSTASEMTKAWLALVSIMGEYPEEAALDEAARVCRLRGGHGLGELMLRGLERASLTTDAVDSELEVMHGGVLLDVSETATHDLHTGIQRVVRELSSRWLSNADVAAVRWNFWANSVKRLSEDEAARLRHWRLHLHEPGSEVKARALGEHTGKTVIPWRSILVLPELIVSPRTSSGYRALARSGVVTRCSMIGYDSVPMTAAETVTEGMTANFGHYLSLVKHASHLAAISHASAEEFRAFGQMLRSQGLPGPTLTARPLPTIPPEVSVDELEIARQEFGVGGLPVIVVVGSHEPRKNHLTVLEAAETMWRSGHKFELIFAGGSSWGGSEFDTYLDSLAAAGFPVRRYARVGEQSLWALYHLAHFTVFPSLLEGYGLPIAESLASGTPVITSNYGSMAEIGSGGGAVLVDPRDSVELASAMISLLEDSELRTLLADEARARLFPTWEQYAEDVWFDLVGPSVR